MRLIASLLTAMTAAVVIAGCGSSAAAPKPDTTGDAAAVAAVKQVCAQAPALQPLSPTQGVDANSAAATANNTPVMSVQSSLVRAAGSLSSTSPLAPQLTDAAAMLLDASSDYGKLTAVAEKNNAKRVDYWIGVARARLVRSAADLTDMGISGCLRSS